MPCDVLGRLAGLRWHRALCGPLLTVRLHTQPDQLGCQAGAATETAPLANQTLKLEPELSQLPPLECRRVLACEAQHMPRLMIGSTII